MPLSTPTKIAIGWTFIVTGGIYLFYASKESVDRRRYENMKIRERMRQANIEMAEGDAQKLMQELEIEMMSDIYNRMTNVCYKKCIPPVYHETEIAKGEAVCIDRCVAKFLDIYERIGKKLGQLSMQDEQLLKK